MICNDTGALTYNDAKEGYAGVGCDDDENVALLDGNCMMMVPRREKKR